MRAFRRQRFKYLITSVLLFALPLILLPEPAWVLVQQEEEELLEQGKQLYMEGRFEEAAEKLTLAVKFLTAKEKLIDAYLHLALCHFALGENGKAKVHLADLLRLNPLQTLDPLYYPPDFVKLLDETKDIVLARIIVKTEPPEARIFFDGELIGVSPFQIERVVAGEHKLRVVKEGYKAKEESLIVKQGEEKTVYIELEKEEEEEKKPPKVAVTPPEKKPEVKKGKGWLWILLGGAAAAAVAILASKGGKETGPPTPTQAFGAIQIKSYPNGATIFLDGNNSGFTTNHTLTNVPTGSRTILLRKAGWKDWQDTVTVYQNQTAVVKPCLLPPNGCFRDNFQDGDDDGWNLAGEWQIKQQGGNYLLEGKSYAQAGCSAIPRTEDRRNFILRFRLKIVSYDNGGFSIDFRNGSQGHYAIAFAQWSSWCGKWLDTTEEWHHLKSAGRISSGEWHNIEIVAKGDNIQLLRDNILMINTYHHDDRVVQGGTQFNIWEGSKSQIDDIVIISEECP